LRAVILPTAVAEFTGRVADLANDFLTGGVCAIALAIRLLPLLRSGDEWALMPDSFK
jgi:hypothetical protein